MSNTENSSFEKKKILVAALLKCDCMKGGQSRDQIVAALPAEIGGRIDRQPSDLRDADSIVSACLRFSNGIEQLIDAVKFYEGDSIALQELVATARQTGAMTSEPKTAPSKPRIPVLISSGSSLPEDAGLQTKATRRYDVFLSHSSSDKPLVERLAVSLEREGVTVFLDKWHLVPGEPWQEKLEEAMDNSAACAVFLGPNGLGPWENEEMRTALDERVSDKSLRVIPVLLPGANPKDRNTLPRFLRRLTWVDFRSGIDDREALRRLVAGIRGEAPGRGDG